MSITRSKPARRRTPARPSVERLLARAVDAFREGRDLTAQAGGASVDLKAKAQKPIQLGRLSAADLATLEKLEPQREQALALARAGRSDEADATMKVARFLLSLSRLTPAGRAYADTMQRAADSYLAYQRGDLDGAQARMVAAIDATDQLAIHWGNSEFIVCRRVDLAHNLMRVEVRRGAGPAAIRIGARLLEYLAGLPGAPDADAPAPVELDPRIVRALCDLVTSTLAELLAPRPASECRALLASLDRVRAHGTVPSDRARAWLDLKAAALDADPRPFLEIAPDFLRAGRGSAPSLWYAAALDLLRLDPPPAGRGEILAELDTGPGLPRSMRVPRAADEPPIQVALRRAAAAFREGRDSPPPAPAAGPSEGEIFQRGQAYVLTRLTAADRGALEALSATREEALLLARRGELDGAAARARAARFLISLAGLSPAGRVYAETMQLAAESFVAYRRGDLAEARVRMVASIDATDELSRLWGNSEFFAGRRVHLAQNLLRVDVASGAVADSMRLATDLLRYLAGATNTAPFASSPEPEPSLPPSVAEAFFDATAACIAELAASLPAEGARAAFLDAAALRALESAPSRRALGWLHLKSAALEEDPHRFLDAVVPFLQAGRGSIPTLWYAAALDLLRLLEANPAGWSTGEAAGIRETLGSAPRLPACLRGALG